MVRSLWDSFRLSLSCCIVYHRFMKVIPKGTIRLCCSSTLNTINTSWVIIVKELLNYCTIYFWKKTNLIKYCIPTFVSIWDLIRPITHDQEIPLWTITHRILPISFISWKVCKYFFALHFLLKCSYGTKLYFSCQHVLFLELVSMT